MYLFRRALQTPPPLTEEATDWPDVEFWQRYETAIRAVHPSSEKCGQLAAMLRDTARRLAGAALIQSSSTRWLAPNALCFDPARIDFSDPSAEQRASLLVMHEPDRAHCVSIVIDLFDVGLRMATGNLFAVTSSQILDGVRLWSTLSRRIARIVVVRPSGIPKVVWNGMFRQAMHLLSGKLRARLRVVNSRDELEPHLLDDGHVAALCGSSVATAMPDGSAGLWDGAADTDDGATTASVARAKSDSSIDSSIAQSATTASSDTRTSRVPRPPSRA